MTSPAYRALSEAGYETDVIGYHESKELFEANPYIRSYRTTDSSYVDKAITVMSLKERYDYVIQFTTSFKTNTLMMFAKGKRVGYSYRLKGLPLNLKVPIQQRTCEKGNRIDEVYDLLMAIGVENRNREMVFSLKKRERQQKGFIGLHVNPRNTQSARRWPHFGELARMLRRSGKRVFYIGNLSDREYIRSIDPEAEIVNTPTIQSLGSFLTRLEKFICVNSFPMHLAQCLKIPTFAIVGATSGSVVCRETENFHWTENMNINPEGVLSETWR